MFMFGLISIFIPIFLVKYTSVYSAIRVIIPMIYFVGCFLTTIVMVNESEYLSRKDANYAQKYVIDSKKAVIPFSSAISFIINICLLTYIPFGYAIIAIFSIFLIGLIFGINYTRKIIHLWNTDDYEHFDKPSKNILRENIFSTVYNYVFGPIQLLIFCSVSFVLISLSKFEFNIIKSAKGDYR